MLAKTKPSLWRYYTLIFYENEEKMAEHSFLNLHICLVSMMFLSYFHNVFKIYLCTY